MSDIHPSILHQLTLYREGAFVPKLRTWKSLGYTNYDGYVYAIGSVGFDPNASVTHHNEWHEMRIEDAHVHIESQAWKAVRDKYREIIVRSVESLDVIETWIKVCVDGEYKTFTGPTDAHALLAMLQHINGDPK